MIPMMPTMPDSGAISGKPDDASPTSAATQKSAYTTSVVEMRDAEGAAGGAGVSLIVNSSLVTFFSGFATAPAHPAAVSIGIAPAVLVRTVSAVAAIAPHQIVVGIERVISVDTIADLEIDRGYRAAVN